MLVLVKSSRSRLRQVAELALEVNELSGRLSSLASKINELARRLNDFEDRLSRCRQVGNALNEIESTKRERTRIKREITIRCGELNEKLTSILEDPILLKESVKCIKLSAYMRIHDYLRKHIDNEDYCTIWYWNGMMGALI